MLPRIQRVVVIAVALLLAAPSPASADGFSVGGSAGAAFAFGQTYYSLGARAGYGVGLGLELDLAGDYLGGATPALFKLSPGLTWYVPLPYFKPYVGAFYSHWFVGSGLADQDSLGARAGITLLSAGPTSAGIGVAYERVMSCTRDCDIWRPEASARLSF
jgi:hypothetical protein